MKVRIGIDVGGTFTDAAVIDNQTYQLIGTVKRPTTHNAAQGVAQGIIDVLGEAMRRFGIRPEDVVFIAHGTTQATNALLEGDVAKVGVLTVGSGLEGMKAKADTTIGRIELAAGKFLNTSNQYVEVAEGEASAAKEAEALDWLKKDGCRSVVAAEAFSVDDDTNEMKIVALCQERGIPCTATSDISKLYGLKIRTRTAVVNASILPKMLDVANMTEQSIKEAGITSPLMVMRCDGGVMTISEVRNRPILTILSGPAAGVAGALIYEKLTDGIFFEVGGTSTDISCVKDGKVMVRYAQVGGHKTYLNSLDVRTVGIGGGSMVALSGGKAADVGPRSAHIAGMDYEVYAAATEIVEPKLCTICPKPGDSDYAYVQCSNGKRFALTLSGAANIAGFVHEGDYAFGCREAAVRAWQPLAAAMGLAVEDLACRVLDFAVAKISGVVNGLVKDYKLVQRTTTFVGGGGGCAVVVPYLAKTMGYQHKNAKNAEVISTIGVALAMVRDMVERSVVNPTDQDILAVRREAELKAISSGAVPGSVEVSVEYDSKRNMVRAVAVGATELRTKDALQQKLSEADLRKIVAKNLGVSADAVALAGRNSGMYAFTCQQRNKKFFGLLRGRNTVLRLIDEEGIIRLQRNHVWVDNVRVSGWKASLGRLMEELTEYNDGGKQLPNIYVVLGKRIIDLSGLNDEAKVFAIGETELSRANPDEPIIIICTHRTAG